MNDHTQYPITASFALLLIGDSGTRKTTTALQLLHNPYVCDLDNNLGGVVRWMRAQQSTGKSGWWTDKQFFYDVPDVLEPAPARRFACAVNGIKGAAKDDRVGGIIIDSSTRLNELLVEQLKSMPIPGSTSTDSMTEAKWGALGDKLIEFIMAVKTCGKPLIVVSHETWDKDEVTGVTRCYPSVQGRLRQTMARLFSDYWRTTVEGEGAGAKYLVSTAPSGRVNCKCSIPGLPVKFELDAALLAKHFPAAPTAAPAAEVVK